ncbi:hypothetical protein BDZ91DRAFT_717991 [Kalaharituber pfeilii]|nr:hypothetical protein BDZ91DRAFT_717991 [Kalaharituber pfeilii]
MMIHCGLSKCLHRLSGIALYFLVRCDSLSCLGIATGTLLFYISGYGIGNHLVSCHSSFLFNGVSGTSLGFWD